VDYASDDSEIKIPRVSNNQIWACLLLIDRRALKVEAIQALAFC